MSREEYSAVSKSPRIYNFREVAAQAAARSRAASGIDVLEGHDPLTFAGVNSG